MSNRLKNYLFTFGLYSVFLSVIVVCAVAFTILKLTGVQMILFFGLFIFALMPVVTYCYNIINFSLSPVHYSDIYVQTVDSILHMESFDEVLRETFDRILNLIRVQGGLLIFYYHDRDEFNIFYQKKGRKRIIRRARVSHDNILFKVVKKPDDIIIKGKLNPHVHIERALIDELDRLNSEIALPIYYHDMFLGMIITGERNRRFTDSEIRLLRIFALKIGVLSVNSFFFKEILKKKELEKEYELASKIQKKFLPVSNVRWGRINIKVFHEANSLMIREFYDVFVNDAAEDDIRISAYRILGNILGTSILMPGVQSMLQSFARLGSTPSRSVSRLKKIIVEKDLIRESLILLHGSLKQNGQFTFFNDQYQTPLIYAGKRDRITAVKTEKNKKIRTVRILHGDILIIASESLHKSLLLNKEHVLDIFKKHRNNFNRLSENLVNALRPYIDDEEGDKLLMLIEVEDKA